MLPLKRSFHTLGTSCGRSQCGASSVRWFGWNRCYAGMALRRVHGCVENAQETGYDDVPQQRGGYLVTAASAKAHPDKVLQHDHGEDAFFTSASSRSFGVADGVSQWMDVNVDAGEYSRLLMQMSQTEAEKMFKASGKVDPKEVLDRAYRKSLGTIGSSTACILALDGANNLHAANLGDSGFMVIRSGPAQIKQAPGQHVDQSIQWDLVYRSYEMQKFFNCPDQLGPGCPDRPARSETFQLPVEPGDIIIAASDGLFDNLSETEVCMIVKKMTAQSAKLFPEQNPKMVSHEANNGGALKKWLKNVSTRLVEEAQTVGLSTTARTPFQKQCIRAGYRHEGGKLDDVVVIASMIVKES